MYVRRVTLKILRTLSAFSRLSQSQQQQQPQPTNGNTTVFGRPANQCALTRQQMKKISLVCLASSQPISHPPSKHPPSQQLACQPAIKGCGKREEGNGTTNTTPPSDSPSGVRCWRGCCCRSRLSSRPRVSLRLLSQVLLLSFTCLPQSQPSTCLAAHPSSTIDKPSMVCRQSTVDCCWLCVCQRLASPLAHRKLISLLLLLVLLSRQHFSPPSSSPPPPSSSSFSHPSFVLLLRVSQL